MSEAVVFYDYGDADLESQVDFKLYKSTDTFNKYIMSKSIMDEIKEFKILDSLNIGKTTKLVLYAFNLMPIQDLFTLTKDSKKIVVKCLNTEVMESLVRNKAQLLKFYRNKDFVISISDRRYLNLLSGFSVVFEPLNFNLNFLDKVYSTKKKAITLDFTGAPVKDVLRVAESFKIRKDSISYCYCILDPTMDKFEEVVKYLDAFSCDVIYVQKLDLYNFQKIFAESYIYLSYRKIETTTAMTSLKNIRFLAVRHECLLIPTYPFKDSVILVNEVNEDLLNRFILVDSFRSTLLNIHEKELGHEYSLEN